MADPKIETCPQCDGRGKVMGWPKGRTLAQQIKRPTLTLIRCELCKGDGKLNADQSEMLRRVKAGLV